MQDMLNTKKFGDIAFRDKDFKTAIEHYSNVCVYSFSLHSLIIVLTMVLETTRIVFIPLSTISGFILPHV